MDAVTPGVRFSSKALQSPPLLNLLFLMRTPLCFPLLFAALALSASAQVCDRDVVLREPGDFVTFNCSVITGNLQALYGAAGLIVSPSQLTRIDGRLTISGNEAAAIVGFSNLVSIGGGLGIVSNLSLLSLSGFEKLETVGGFVPVSSNKGFNPPPERITQFSGFDVLREAGGSLNVRNGLFAQVDPLASLESVGGQLNVSGNSKLSRCAVGLGPILALERDDPSTMGSVYGLARNGGGTCNSEAAALARLRRAERAAACHGLAERRLVPEHAPSRPLCLPRAGHRHVQR